MCAFLFTFPFACLFKISYGIILTCKLGFVALYQGKCTLPVARGIRVLFLAIFFFLFIYLFIYLFICNKRLLINNIQGTKLVLITYGRENLGGHSKIKGPQDKV
jgi:uncharacterized membrane protein